VGARYVVTGIVNLDLVQKSKKLENAVMLSFFVADARDLTTLTLDS